jgi:hypothetical protein
MSSFRERGRERGTKKLFITPDERKYAKNAFA